MIKKMIILTIAFVAGAIAVQFTSWQCPFIVFVFAYLSAYLMDRWFVIRNSN